VRRWAILPLLAGVVIAGRADAEHLIIAANPVACPADRAELTPLLGAPRAGDRGSHFLVPCAALSGASPLAGSPWFIRVDTVPAPSTLADGLRSFLAGRSSDRQLSDDLCSHARQQIFGQLPRNPGRQIEANSAALAGRPACEIQVSSEAERLIFGLMPSGQHLVLASIAHDVGGQDAARAAWSEVFGRYATFGQGQGGPGSISLDLRGRWGATASEAIRSPSAWALLSALLALVALGWRHGWKVRQAKS
jgi:hypothetical protein